MVSDRAACAWGFSPPRRVLRRHDVQPLAPDLLDVLEQFQVHPYGIPIIGYEHEVAALTTEDGTTAVMIAAGLGKRAAQEITHYQWDETKAIAALGVALDARVDINAANEHGETALHAAAYHNANDVIRFLVTAGARIDATNAARQTPLRVADGHLICCTTFARHEEASRVLRELGADPNAGVQLTFGLTAFGDADSPSR